MPDTPKSKNPHVTTKYFASHCDSLYSKIKKKKKEQKKKRKRGEQTTLDLASMCVSKSPPSNLASYAKVPAMSSIDIRSCHVNQSYQMLVLSSMLCL